MHPYLLALLALICAACASVPAQATSGCEGGIVSLQSNFEGAGRIDCQRVGESKFAVRVLPEATPINPSPWYAFDIVATESARVEILLGYQDATHRYWPKQLTSDGWIRVPESAVEILAEANGARLTLNVPAGTVRISAQEIMTPQSRQDWAADWAQRSGFHLHTIGRSQLGRPILAMSSRADPGDRPLVLVLGGQHPPEVSGVIGLRAFLETFTGAGDDVARFLDTFSVLVVPDLNPDGVSGGNWRLNAAGVDLNRDWGKFTQPETRAVLYEIERHRASGSQPVVLLDFHSTYRNVFYTPPDNFGATRANFSRNLMERLEALWPGEQPARSASHSHGKPTAKTWFAETYKAPGITIEFADEADRDIVRELAHASALALIEVLASPAPASEDIR
jgi:cytosolic carboxypeptidase protein 6